MTIAKGYAATNASEPLTSFTFERREPVADDVRIAIKFCGVCHSDVITKEGLLPGISYPRVPGHEVAGVIDELYNAVVDGRAPLHDGAWGMATLEVCLAILQSARSGAEVTITRHAGVL